MAQANERAQRRRLRTPFIVLGALLLLIAIAAAAAYMLIRNSQLAILDGYGKPAAGMAADGAPSMAGTAGSLGGADSASAEAGDPATHTFVTLDIFTVNLADRDRERFAQVGVVIELSDKALKAFKPITPVVRSDILLLLSSKSAAELLTLEGKQKILREIVAITRKYIAPERRNEVYGAHFASFVIQ
ncbi:hypothetical protein GCM10023144_44250 [Pigmentiphaga soli]|uniref:Flagellar protein FliL n=1 Tax=Pigmentiphaga soli TaxID=1007095 RepID=A0ABP8HPN0_9BURK